MDLNEKLKAILNYEHPLGITISGNWGIGKTYFWKEFIKNYPQNNKFAYVSLFRKYSINDIMEDIMTQISVAYKLLGKNSKIAKIFSNLKPINIALPAIGLLLSVLVEEEGNDQFKNLVVCFDDLERMSDSIDYKTLLGYISYLKETLRCKIVLILNEEEINKQENKKIFNEYKEKIIDKDFFYRPTPEENFKLIEERILFSKFKEELLSFLKKYQINNIRIMLQIIFTLNEFKFLESLTGINNEVKSEFIQKLIVLSFIKFKFNFTDFKAIESCEYAKISQDIVEGKDNKIKEIIPYLSDLSSTSFFIIDSLIEPIMEYLKESIIKEDSIIETLKKEDKRYKNHKRYENFLSFFGKIYYDFNYGFDNFKKETKSFLENNKDNILNILDIKILNAYIFECIKICRKFNQSEDVKFYENYFGDVFENYIDAFKDDFKIYNLDETSICNSLIFCSDALKKRIIDYINKKKIEIYKIYPYNSKKLMELMKTIRYKNGWDKKDEEICNNIPTDNLKGFIFNNADFLRGLIEFYNFAKTSGSFTQYIEKVNKILEEISNTDDGKYEIKIKLIKEKHNI